MPATKIKIILAKCLDVAWSVDIVPDFASILWAHFWFWPGQQHIYRIVANFH